ncbi:MAG: hypothetical protein ACK56I_21040, partial [bacterium]
MFWSGGLILSARGLASASVLLKESRFTISAVGLGVRTGGLLAAGLGRRSSPRLDTAHETTRVKNFIYI